MGLTYVRNRLRDTLSKIKERIFDTHAMKSYSQEGEDMVLRRLFDEKIGPGFYIDVGAHHPRRFSNTNFFYRRGWSGINIEPNPDVAKQFAAGRKRDINLQLGVSDRQDELTYYFFNDPALNTFDHDLAASRLENPKFKIVGIRAVKVERLDEILRKNLLDGQKIDFLSIDVEGLDLAVLRSNDWRSYRPVWVLVEALRVPLEKMQENETYRFMQQQGYELYAKTFNTLFFRNRNSAAAGPRNCV